MWKDAEFLSSVYVIHQKETLYLHHFNDDFDNTNSSCNSVGVALSRGLQMNESGNVRRMKEGLGEEICMHEFNFVLSLHSWSEAETALLHSWGRVC